MATVLTEAQLRKAPKIRLSEAVLETVEDLSLQVTIDQRYERVDLDYLVRRMNNVVHAPPGSYSRRQCYVDLASACIVLAAELERPRPRS